MVQLIFMLVVLGVVVYLINHLLPIDDKFKLVINCIIGLVLLWYVLSFFGFIGPMPFPQGRYR